MSGIREAWSTPIVMEYLVPEADLSLDSVWQYCAVVLLFIKGFLWWNINKSAYFIDI